MGPQPITDQRHSCFGSIFLDTLCEPLYNPDLEKVSSYQSEQKGFFMFRKSKFKDIFFQSVTCITLFCFLFGIALTGCSDSSSNPVAGPEPDDPGVNRDFTITGLVTFDGVISGADVSLYSEQGELFHEELRVTNASGQFSFEVKDVPERFFIKARGGEEVFADGTSRNFDEELGRYVENFDPARDININILSDALLIAWEDEPQTKYSELKLFAANYLCIPQYYDMEDAINAASWDTAVFNFDYFSDSMQESGYSDYKNFVELSSRIIADKFLDGDFYDGMPWMIMPKSWYDSAFISMYMDLENPFLDSSIRSSAQSKSYFKTAGGLLDTALGILGFILNAIAKNTAETDAGRTLGIILQYMFEGGPDPQFNAIMANLTAIQEGVQKIDTDLNNFWTQTMKELKNIQQIVLSTKVNEATSKIRNWNDELKTWAKNAKPGQGATYPGASVVQEWTNHVGDTSTGVKQRAEDIYDGLVPASGKSVIQAWFESMQQVTTGNNPKTNEILYKAMRDNLLRLITYQALAVNVYSEMVHKTKTKAEATDLTGNFVTLTLTRIKREVETFEEVIEKYAVDQEWYVYAPCKSSSTDRTPDFPGGLAKNGVLADLDSIVQRYLFSDVVIDPATHKPKSLNTQNLITVRIVSPKENGTAGDDDLGFTGFSKQSSYYWEVYMVNPHASYPCGKEFKPEGIPVTPPGAPGSGMADKAFEVSKVTVSLGGQSYDLSPTASGTKDYTGRSPFEYRSTQIGSKESWEYRLIKLRKAGGFDIQKDVSTSVKMDPQINTAIYGWHPNLDQPPGHGDTYKWSTATSPGPCLTFGAYALKKPQKTRIMAYHGQNGLHDWFLRGYDNNWGKDYLFANRAPAYTFFDTYALGNHWYAFKEAGTNLSRTWKVNVPFCYYGPVLEKSKYRTAGKNYVSVNQKGHMVFDKNHIEYDSAFKVENRSNFPGQKYKIGATAPDGTWFFYYLPQPQSNLYSFKTNYPAGLKDPGKNNYLKWAYQFAAWDRLFANGTVTDAGQNKDAWFIIYPEYDNLANWLLTRPDGWFPY